MNASEREFVFGASPVERIVSCENTDTGLEVFLEDQEGVRSIHAPAAHWLLSPRPLEGAAKLAGDNPFRYFKTFETKREWWEAKRANRGAEFLNIWDDKEAAMMVGGFTYYKGMRVDEVSTLAFDIEATGLNHDESSRVLLISNTFRSLGRVERRLFAYDEYESESAMFDAWSAWVREINPSILVGHNIYSYDLPYMDFCASRAGTTLALGRDGSHVRFDSYESKYRRDGSQFYTYHRANIYGREIVDTFFLSMKYDIGRKYSTYGLKTIIKEEGLEIADRQHYDAATIAKNYKNPEQWELIKAYATHDADDTLALFDLMIPAYFYLTRSIPKPLQSIVNGASGSWINSFLVRSYLQVGHSVPRATEGVEFEGAISIGNPGIYENVFKVDVASLYPSVMLEHRVYDETKDPRAHFLKMVEYFTAERLANKTKAKETGERYYKDLSEAQKVVINSAYGMMGAPGLNFNSPANAAKVTRIGREILTKAIEWSKENGFTLVNADTDSIAISGGAGSRGDILSSINSLYPQRIRWEDDGLYEKVLVLKAKNYVLVQEGKRKVKGSALKATLKEPALREFINELITLLLDRAEPLKLRALYERYVTEITSLKDITRWSSKKTITEKVLNPERTNEQRVLDAIEGEDYSQGDKLYFYFRADGTLSLATDWTGDHDVNRLLEKLYKTVVVFKPVLDINNFPNYKLKRNKKLLSSVA